MVGKLVEKARSDLDMLRNVLKVYVLYRVVGSMNVRVVVAERSLKEEA